MADDQSFTVSEFCAAERISRSLLYRLWREGAGPKFYNVASNRRISADARRKWRERRGVGALGACYILVPQNSGLSLGEVEAILTRNRLQGH